MEPTYVYEINLTTNFTNLSSVKIFFLREYPLE